MKDVNADSICKHSHYGFHNWFVSRHDAQWHNYECICSFCGASSYMSAGTFAELQDRRDRWWAERQKGLRSTAERVGR